MRHGGLTKPFVIAVLCAAALTAAGGMWGIVSWSGGADANPSNLPSELTAASLKKQAEADPARTAETIFESFEREDLNVEQRRELRQNAREVMQAQMDKRVDEYFNTPEEQRQVLLDRHIDEMAKFREQMRQRSEQRRAENEARDDEGGDRPPDESRERRDPRRRMGATAQERKERSESRDPDRMARRITYFTAMRKQMEARGIEMPGRGPGFGGGPR